VGVGSQQEVQGNQEAAGKVAKESKSRCKETGGTQQLLHLQLGREPHKEGVGYGRKQGKGGYIGSGGARTQLLRRPWGRSTAGLTGRGKRTRRQEWGRGGGPAEMTLNGKKRVKTTGGCWSNNLARKEPLKCAAWGKQPGGGSGSIKVRVI